ACWFFGFLFFWKIPRLRGRFKPGTRVPPLSLIIPARNEEKNLDRLLRSIKNGNPRPDEIIVVDDHSEDATGEVGIRAGCKVIASAELPEGWVGKTWACWQGVGQARGDLILFLDADTVLEPGGFSRLVETYLGKGGLVSVYPYHRMERPYERLSAFFNLISLAGTGSFTLLGSWLNPRGAFGPCMLCSRRDYLAVGGHAGERIRGEILESLGMEEAFRQKGLPVHLFGGKGAISFRMYPSGLRSLREGFGKSLGVGFRGTPSFLLVLIVLWISGGFSTTRHLLQNGLLADWSALAIWAVMDLLYVLQIFRMLASVGNFTFVTALFFQIPLFFFLAVFSTSLIRTFLFRRVTWKGRTVKISSGSR
ncbi:MAG: glycosyltransferase family 2 protein, partial [Desulfobacterota bacterium]|nr:glycosyltransferase family 2 protein [Thermodesulfobacteriota bacterium]